MPPYSSLYRKYREQPAKEIFAHFPWRSDLGEEWQVPWERLANLAQPEIWQYHDTASQDHRDYPILMYYLQQIFVRVQTQGKIIFSEDQSKCCFNTGLQTQHQDDIYALFHQQQYGNPDYPDWTLFGFHETGSSRLSGYDILPEPATFFTHPAELVFDPSFDVDIPALSLVRNHQEHFPDVFGGNLLLAENVLQTVSRKIIKQLSRYPALALPSWYDGSICLALPLNLQSINKPTLALILKRNDDKKRYMGIAILPLETAYLNARLIQPLNQPWLCRATGSVHL